MESLLHKLAKYKCVGCDFIGEFELTMYIHVERFYSDEFECVVCDVIFENQENLETHLKTCEKFRCRNCDKHGKNIIGIDGTHSRETFRYSQRRVDIAH